MPINTITLKHKCTLYTIEPHYIKDASWHSDTMHRKGTKKLTPETRTPHKFNQGTMCGLSQLYRDNHIITVSIIHNIIVYMYVSMKHISIHWGVLIVLGRTQVVDQ